MVYNFTLPPLVLHTFYRENTEALSKWAKELEFVSKTTTFFNILDTHDGVGLLGVRNILHREDIDFIVQKAKDHGALISYRTGGDGKYEPYEINTTWFSALNKGKEEDIAFQVKRFVASRSLALVLKGIPGIYFHGLIGSLNNHDIVKTTGSRRDINRDVIEENDVRKMLLDPLSRVSHIRNQLGNILGIRVRHKAFHPNGEQRVLTLSSDIFTIVRVSPDGKQHILTMTNVTNRPSRIEIPISELMVDATRWYDLVSKRELSAINQRLEIVMEPYDIIWLLPFHEWEETREA